MNGKFKPEALYTKTHMERVEIIPFETAVVGTAICYDRYKREVLVDLGCSWIGVIPEEETTVYELTYPEGKLIPPEINGIIGKQIRAIVTYVDPDKHILQLSRKMSMEQAWEAMEEETNLIACITNNLGYGIFLDIGNGIITYNTKVDCSTIKISNTKIWFEVGESIKVRLIKKGEDASSRVISSHKLAYPDLSQVNNFISVGDIIPVRIGKGELADGYFCQFGPQIKGIIDTYELLNEGEVVMGVVKKITDKGLKLKYLY